MLSNCQTILCQTPAQVSMTVTATDIEKINVVQFSKQQQDAEPDQPTVATVSCPRTFVHNRKSHAEGWRKVFFSLCLNSSQTTLSLKTHKNHWKWAHPCMTNVCRQMIPFLPKMHFPNRIWTIQVFELRKASLPAPTTVPMITKFPQYFGIAAWWTADNKPTFPTSH